MIFHMGRAKDGPQKMEHGEPQKDPDPGDVKNSGNQKRGEKQQEHVSECRKDYGGQEHHGEAKVEGPGFAGFLAGKGAEGFKVTPERSQEAEQPGDQSARPWSRWATGRRSASMAGRFQTRVQRRKMIPSRKPTPTAMPTAFNGFCRM